MTAFHTIIGMPASGKTTFLAALWHLITSAELDPALLLDRLEGDANYLNKIVEVWQRCERHPCTSRAEENAIDLHMKDKETGAPITLNFIDLSGETFHRQSPVHVSGRNPVPHPGAT
jgi:Double-GTPase 1